MLIGLVLIAVGIIALLVKLGVLTGSVWSYTWPVILIILGLTFLWGRCSWRAGGWRRWCCFPGEEEEKK